MRSIAAATFRAQSKCRAFDTVGRLDPMKTAARVRFPVSRGRQLLPSPAAYILPLASLLVGGTLLSAPVASAYTSDPFCESDPPTCYIKDLVSSGIPQPKTANDIHQLLTLGDLVCQDIRGKGISVVKEMQKLEQLLNAPVDTVAAVVTAALADLCWVHP